MVGVLLVLLGGPQTAPAARTPDPAPLQVRVYVDPGFDRPTIERSLGAAGGLLASAGIDLVWRLCDPASRGEPPQPPREVAIILSGRPPTTRVRNCGRTAMGTRPGDATVLISVSCVADMAARLAALRHGLEHPLLMRAAYDDLLGAVEAHELGHVLGLRHGAGLMRAALCPNDIVELRLGQLAFSRAQSAKMRTLLTTPVAGELAARVP
jgi:hypothetical protein